jgi:hypothetical protein
MSREAFSYDKQKLKAFQQYNTRKYCSWLSQTKDRSTREKIMLLKTTKLYYTKGNNTEQTRIIFYFMTH